MKKRPLEHYQKAHDLKLALYAVVLTAAVISTILFTIY